MPTHSAPSTPAEIEAQLQRLMAQREALEQQRQALRIEELKVLADAYARKLQAAGFTVKEGLAALKPYAGLRMASEEAAAPSTPKLWRSSPANEARAAAHANTSGSAGPRHAAAGAGGQDLQSRAAQVLGEDASRWLRRPHPLLGGQAPQQVAGLPGGLDKVLALLAAYARGA